MFSKSKRFPEVEKDYIPGPGEYEVLLDDSSPYKRHGFISQTSRFSDMFEPTHSSEFYLTSPTSPQKYIHNPNFKHDSMANMSSLSVSSTTSSLKSYMEDPSVSTATKKTLHTPPDTPVILNQFEKHKYAMQREIDTLQMKTKKLESIIQSLENDKNDTKSIIISKDLELADLRSKNKMLQKTISRQEVNSKATQLQRKIDQLEKTLEEKQAEFNHELQEKNNTIELLNQEILKNSVVIGQFESRQEENFQKQTSLEAHISDLIVQMTASEYNMKMKDMQLNEFQNQIDGMTQSIQSLDQQIESHTADVQRLSTEKLSLNHQLDDQAALITQLENTIQSKDQEIDTLCTEANAKAIELNHTIKLVRQLQTQFVTYRHYMSYTVIPHLRNQQKEKDERHMKEFNRVLKELFEAKKFMNKQAQHMDGLKSDVHWLVVQKDQLSKMTMDMTKEHTQEINLIKRIIQRINNRLQPTSAPVSKRKPSKVQSKRHSLNRDSSPIDILPEYDDDNTSDSSKSTLLSSDIVIGSNNDNFKIANEDNLYVNSLNDSKFDSLSNNKF